MRSITALDDLGTQDMDRLLQQTEADRYNDAALRNTFLLGGSLGAFGIGASAGGFSTYVLAAQASAFIPLVSGTGLVSFVSVLSNPITVLGVAGGGGYWLLTSATKRVRAAIAARVAAMLALQSKLSGPSGLERLPDCFACIATLYKNDELAKGGLDKYYQQWRRLGSLYAQAPAAPPKSVLRHSTRPLRSEHPKAGDEAHPANSTATTELQNAAAMATLTLGDALYTLAAINPHVIAAADFSRLDAIDNEWSFAQLAEHILTGSDGARLGAVSQLKGYVAEQAVAAQLIDAGHTVSLPEVSNQSGWDLLVDGHPVQVKFHATPAGIAEHFEHYSYPVIANEELRDHIPEQWADQVFFIDGLSGELIEQITRDSLTAGAHLLDHDVISMAAIISTARGVLAYRKNELSFRQTLEQILLDGAIRTGLAAGASAAGSGIGFWVFGPAGALCLGKGAPILSQMITPNVKTRLNTSIKGAAHHQWEAKTHHLISALIARLREALQHKRTVSQQRSQSMPRGELGEYLRWRLSDDALFFEECDTRLRAISSASLPEQRLADTLKVITVCGVHPVTYQSELTAVNEALKNRPGLAQLIDHDRLNAALTDTLTRARDAGSYLKTRSSDFSEHGLNDKAKSFMSRWRKK
ncbi:hypothetical protein [Larsenimonas suaedae]|uniref:Uncharacterized protein n=1 Tax=Larsenimonas suaedae TaxID=1851019 RepID=A0ABU1GW42_9GAMM|nr:hypothetical protein [Larsenimonas suaedae]MCM2973330.1 hypothetical protein [Larsenimonas suaedae]MDR5896223.1 hypothetical protein [Larsenimonas suaedae]